MKMPGDASTLYAVRAVREAPREAPVLNAADRAERALFWRIACWGAVTAAAVVGCGVLLGAWLSSLA